MTGRTDPVGVSGMDLVVLCLLRWVKEEGQPTSEVRFQDLSTTAKEEQIERFFSSTSAQ